MTAIEYRGSELSLFARATNWKMYTKEVVSPYVKGAVLEVGAGIGTVTKILYSGQLLAWVCLEPDRSLYHQLSKTVCTRRLPNCRAINGTLADLRSTDQFDTIVYVDVLEHIEDDRGELLLAAEHLRQDGNLVVLAPAHQWLYSPFDSAIGHFRRYGRNTLSSALPSGVVLVKTMYLDTVGLSASALNKLLLRRMKPSIRQIVLWDRFMVPLSRPLDRLSGYRIGKSLLMVAQKRGKS
ncbi:MAG: methyltransferase domain-containing protein [Chitinivibrionales bacterium]|nr:methyltransferase domain-containing protein [Chitinivibrionales bacterium]